MMLTGDSQVSILHPSTVIRVTAVFTTIRLQSQILVKMMYFPITLAIPSRSVIHSLIGFYSGKPFLFCLQVANPTIICHIMQLVPTGWHGQSIKPRKAITLTGVSTQKHKLHSIHHLKTKSMSYQ